MTFVLLCPRRGEEVLRAELDDFLHFTGLAEHELEQRPLTEADSTLGSFEGVEGVFIGGSPFTITSPVLDHDSGDGSTAHASGLEDTAPSSWQDTVSRRLVDFVTSQDHPDGLPIFSACYGTSMLAHYLGGQVGTAYSESAGASRVCLTEEGKKDPLTGGLPECFQVMTGHKDSVVELPTGATLLASGDNCPVQIYRFGHHTWTSQFHPEMDSERIATRLSFYEDAGYAAREDLAETYERFKGVDTQAANSLLRRFVDYCREG